MKKKVIDDIQVIVETMIDYGKDSKQTLLIGYYDTIITAFNMLIKSSDAEFVAGEIDPYEWVSYDDAYYLEYDGEEIYVGRTVWKGHDRYLIFDGYSVAFIEEDFYEDFCETNTTNNAIPFGFSDVNEQVDKQTEDDQTSLCMDEDECGFCFCIGTDDNHTKFRYRGNKKLTQSEVGKMINEYLF